MVSDNLPVPQCTYFPSYLCPLCQFRLWFLLLRFSEFHLILLQSAAEVLWLLEGWFLFACILYYHSWPLAFLQSPPLTLAGSRFYGFDCFVFKRRTTQILLRLKTSRFRAGQQIIIDHLRHQLHSMNSRTRTNRIWVRQEMHAALI